MGEMQATLPATAPLPHVYPHRWYRQRRALRFVYAVNPVICIAVGIGEHNRLLLGLGILNVLTAFLNIRQSRSRLIVAPAGVTYDYGGAVLRVPWGDMLRIGPVAQRLHVRSEGVVLRAVHWERAWWYPFPTRWLPQYLPLWNRTMGALWDRAVFDDLFRHAPWLAGEGRKDGGRDG